MAQNSAKKQQIIVRREKVWNLRVNEGLSQAEIAKIVSVTQPTVMRDLHVISKALTSKLEDTAMLERIIQIKRLEMMVKEALQAWGKSKLGKRIIREHVWKSIVLGKDGKPLINTKNKEITYDTKIETITQFNESNGNINYFNAAVRAMKELRDIMGIDAPKEIILDWKMELEKLGIPSEQASMIFEEMVNVAYKELKDKVIVSIPNADNTENKSE